jgi:tetratricopeptide (TPR) repeat protein
MARTRLELASAEGDSGRRFNIQNQARADLEAFIKNNPKHPLAADASLEIARISALQGRALLTRARRQEGREGQRAELEKARRLFEDAAARLDASAQQIDAQLAATTGQGSVEKQALLQAKFQAEFEKGLNLLDQAQTYTEQSEAATRGKKLKDAIEALDKVAKREPRTPLTWLAIAWLGRCHQENDDPKAARKVYAEVIAEKGDQAEAGKRLARFFRMQALSMDVQNKKRLAEVQQAGEEWLDLYPGFVNSPEGIGVRFELANAYVEQVAAMPKTQQQSAAARQLYDKAQKIFEALEQTENEYSAAAHEKNLNIILIVSQERTKGDISKLRDFRECYLRALWETALLNQATKKLPEAKLEAERRKHYQNILEALGRGLDLVDESASPEDVNNARALLAYVYLATGDYYRAVVAGEDLARTEIKSSKAPIAGAYALRAYSLLLAKQEQDGVDKDELAADRERMRRLAGYIEQTWPEDSAADFARHIQGILLLNDKKYAEAVEVLDRIATGYPEAIRAYFQLAGAVLQVQKDETIKPPPGKPSYQERLLAALTRMPELTSGADAATVHDYFNAKLVLADLYYRAKQFDKVDALAEALLKRLDGLDEKTKAEQQAGVVILSLYAKQGRAEAEYAAGQYGKARDLLEPLIKQLKDPMQAARFTEIKERDPRILRLVLGLAMRASVQDNKIDAGKEILDLTQKSFPENSLDILVQLVQQLQEQIQQLQQQGDKAKEQLDKTVSNFTTFLDELAKQQEKSPKAAVLLFLAQSYSSLDNHPRAAELVSQVPEPKPAEGQTEADPKEMRFYQVARILHVRELRLSKDFKNAEAALKALMTTKWAPANLEVKKERIFLMQDQEHYVLPNKQGAIAEWDKLMRTLKPKIQDPKIKDQYFDCYYNLTYCLYKNALKLADPKAKAKYLHSAANYVVSLLASPDTAVEPCKKRFEELLEKEPVLKQQCEEFKKSTKSQPGGSPK